MFNSRIIICILVLCTLCHGTISLSHTSLPTSATGAGNLSFTITSTTGNIIVVGIVIDDGNTVTSCTDNKSNSYTVNATSETSTGGDVFWCYAFSTTSATTSVTIHKSTNCGVEIVVYDLSSSTGGTLDTVAGSSGSSTNPAQAITAAGAGFVASVVASGQQCTAVAAPFTLDTFDQSNIVHFGMAGHDVNGSGGSITATFTANNGTWAIMNISIKEGSAVAAKHNMTLLGVGP